jgi:hypothetical protein
MTDNYTPGPWGYNGEIIFSGTYSLATGWTNHQNIAVMDACPNWEANAKLIAAAPELLEAAEYFLTTTRWMTENVSSVKDARTILIKAIMKAKGV